MRISKADILIIAGVTITLVGVIPSVISASIASKKLVEKQSRRATEALIDCYETLKAFKAAELDREEENKQ